MDDTSGPPGHQPQRLQGTLIDTYAPPVLPLLAGRLVGIRVADMSAESEAQLGLADRLIHVPVHELRAVGVIEA